MPNILVGYMDKKINSTKTTFTGTTLSCKLKENCSMYSPSFIVQGLTKAHFYNYCKFEDKYYWISNITYETTDIQIISCTMDALATFKTEIKAANGYCNFGPESKGPVKKTVIDSRFNPDLLPYVTNDYVSAFNDQFDSSGCVVMKIVSFPADGDYSMKDAGVCTIVGTQSQFTSLLRLYCKAIGEGVADIPDTLGKIIAKAAGCGNALDSIKSAIWLPFPVSAFSSGNAFNGNIGGWPLTGTWYTCKSSVGVPNIVTTTYNISLQQNHILYPWLLNPAYTVITISTPFGTSVISDTSFMYGIGSADLKIRIRFAYNAEGDCFLDFRDADAGTKLVFHKWNIAVDLKQFIYKAQSNTVAVAQGAGQIVKTGLSVYFGGAAAASGAASTMAEGSEAFGFYGGKLTGDAVTKMSDTSSMEGFKNIGNGISGAAASVNANVISPAMCGMGNSLIGLYTNSAETKDIIAVNVKMYMPRLIYDGKYDEYCDEYGWPVMTYTSMDVNGPYQMSGCSVKAKAPPAVLSHINSVVNSLIYIED